MTTLLLTDDELAAMLSQSLGEAKARDVLRQARADLGLRPGALDPAKALELLEHIAEQPGIVGLTARFAKSRVHLAKLGHRKNGDG